MSDWGKSKRRLYDQFIKSNWQLIEHLDKLIEEENNWMDDAEKRDDYVDVFYHEGKKHAYQYVKELIEVR